MKNSLFITLYLLLISNIVFSQNPESKVNYALEKEIANFSQAGDLVKNPLNFFFVTDLKKNQIIKIKINGTHVKSIGGFGNGNYSFTEPVDIFESALNVYVCDRDNGRIVVYDKDLNFLWEFSGENYGEYFRFPISCSVDGFGNLYILDDENKRILKFTSRGEFLLGFGGFDHKDFNLKNPKKILTNEQNIYVLDENQIFIFDQFGNGKRKISLKSDFENFSVSGNKIFLCGGKKVSVINPDENFSESEIELFGYDFESGIKQTIAEKEIFYVLTENELLGFKTEKAD